MCHGVIYKRRYYVTTIATEATATATVTVTTIMTFVWWGLTYLLLLVTLLKPGILRTFLDF